MFYVVIVFGFVDPPLHMICAFSQIIRFEPCKHTYKKTYICIPVTTAYNAQSIVIVKLGIFSCLVILVICERIEMKFFPYILLLLPIFAK